MCPRRPANPSAVPLVFAFHGLCDSCENFGPAVGISDEAEKRNFLYVYPCATVGALGAGWNAGTCCVSGVDDVGFTRAMVANITSTFLVDTSRIFVSGFSNGAFMAEILGCVAPDIFKATVSVAGVVEMQPGNADGLAACTAAYHNFTSRVSTLNIHGTLDLVVPWTGDAFLGFPPIPDNFAAWGQRNGCTDQPTQTYNKGAFTNQVYKACEQGTRVEVVQNAGGGHQWPHNSDFDTTTYLCDFFGL